MMPLTHCFVRWNLNYFPIHVWHDTDVSLSWVGHHFFYLIRFDSHALSQVGHCCFLLSGVTLSDDSIQSDGMSYFIFLGWTLISLGVTLMLCLVGLIFRF